MAIFHLIRHAERAGDQQLLVGRNPGVHLTAAGRAHAEQLARMLAAEPITRIYSSPLERARETAAPLARARGLTVGTLDAIGEIAAGDWTGRTFPQLDAESERWRQFNHFRSGIRMPNGESAVDVQARFVNAMLRLRDEFPSDGIALVSHADPIKIALACFLGAPLDLYDRMEISLGSVSVVRLENWGAKVLQLNWLPDRAPAPS